MEKLTKEMYKEETKIIFIVIKDKAFLTPEKEKLSIQNLKFQIKYDKE